MLDPEFFFDEELATTENSAYVRLFYQGLWCHCDDIFHTLPFKPGWLRANIFPYEQVDVKSLWDALVSTGKIVEFTEEGQMFGWIKNFSKFQRVEKPSRSKYPQYPGSVGVVGEESVTSPAKEKLSKEKRSEENVANAPDIPVFERKIREKEEEYRALVKDLAAHDYLTNKQIHDIIIEEFLPYWLERGEGARKSRWEKESVFDYQRRIRTWIKNFHEGKKRQDWKCTDDMWHQKGEKCRCSPEVETPKGVMNPAQVAQIREIALAKRV